MVGDQAGMPANLALPALLAVDLLDHRQRDHDLVVLEREDRVRIVQQDIRVKNVDLLHVDCLKRSSGTSRATRVGRRAGAVRGKDELAYSPWYSNGSSWAIFVIR